MSLAAVVFLYGIGWGLPSRAVDPLLFGQRQPWSGEHILALLPTMSDGARAADVDVNPILDRDRPIDLNETDVQRAEIIQRYRLFSFQPDEMITFSALSGMNPSRLQLDPKLYQYGGMWIYPVGALLKLASKMGIVTLTADRAFYLDHPEQFGRFYSVARLYTVAWALLGVWAVFWIARRVSGSLIAATGAALCYIVMPVVINMSHEAKPHLPGAALVLCAIIAATKFVEAGATRWWVITSLLCGAATGMVLSAFVSIVILPLMVFLRRDSWPRRGRMVLLGMCIVAVTYSATNPYVLINLTSNRDVLRSNFANTAAMYEVGRLSEGFIAATCFLREAASVGLLICGLMGLISLCVNRKSRPNIVLVLVPAAIVFVQLAALGAGKPGEFGRFAILPAITLAVAANCAVAILLRSSVARIVLTALLVVLTATPGWFYLRGFIKDSSSLPTRYEDAMWLRTLQHAGGRTLAVYAEPAPYSLPPVDLFHWKLVLLPRGFDIAQDPINADVIVRAVDETGPNGASAGPFVRQSILGTSDAFPTRISWAAKPFEVWIRPELIERMHSRTPTTRYSP